MGAEHPRLAMQVVKDIPVVSEPGVEANAMSPVASFHRPDETAGPRLRVLLAERRASAHSELSRRLDHAGHEVLARVTSAQGALDYAALLRPDVVLIAPALDDGPGVMAALTLTRELPGVAAVVLTTHPAAADPAARPNWGAVTVVPADVDPSSLDAELRQAVRIALDLAATELPATPAKTANAGFADRPPLVAPTPQYATPIEQTPVIATPASARANGAPAEAAATIARPNLDFTDDDLRGIGPFVHPTEQNRSTPTRTAPPTPPPTQLSQDPEAEMVAEAAECLLERTGLSRSDAIRLMEREAADSGQRLIEVARAVLGRDGSQPIDGAAA